VNEREDGIVCANVPGVDISETTKVQRSRSRYHLSPAIEQKTRWIKTGRPPQAYFSRARIARPFRRMAHLGWDGWRKVYQTAAVRRSRPRWSIIVSAPIDHRAARTRHPDAVALDGGVEVAAALMLIDALISRVLFHST